MPMIMATCRRGSARAVAMHCDRRAFIAIVGGSILAAPLAGEAQQTGKAYRVGLFASAPIPDNLLAFRNGLRALGYVEANNVVMEQRYGVGKMPLSTALLRYSEPSRMCLLGLRLAAARSESWPAFIAALDTTPPISKLLTSGPTGTYHTRHGKGPPRDGRVVH